MTDRFIPYIVTLLVTISVLLAGWFYDHSEEERFRQSQRLHVAQQIDTVQAKLEKFLYDRLFLVRGLVAFVKARPHFTESEFQQFARGLQDKQEVIRSLQLAPGSVVTHIYPLAGNEAALGHDLMADPDRRVEVQRAIDNRLFVIAGPVNLRQGGVALIGRTPIFLPRSDEPSGPDRYWGLAIILVDLEPLLRDAGILEKPAGLRFALRGKHGLGAQGERFFGPEAIFESDPALAQVVLPNGSWQLAAVPAGGWTSPRPGAFVERAVILWLAGVTGLLIWLLARGRARLRKAVDEATRDLMLQTEALRDSEERYRKLNEMLEQRVRERTAELRDAQDQLLRQERLAALGQLTATVSHELRNPLGTIRASIYSISKKIRDKDLGVERALDRVERNITRCDDIIGDLLDFTRVRELSREPTSIDAWLDDVLDEHALPDGVAFNRELGSGAELAIDRGRLGRAVINIIDNACHATVQVDKSIVRNAEPRPPGQDNIITVRSEVVDERVEVSISDTGPGIPADVLPKVFDPLFSTKSFGVGLGLPTVKQIVEQHGGGIEISSEEGRGTRVVLWLPTEASGQRQVVEA